MRNTLELLSPVWQTVPQLRPTFFSLPQLCTATAHDLLKCCSWSCFWGPLGLPVGHVRIKYRQLYNLVGGYRVGPIRYGRVIKRKLVCSLLLTPE
jgi:hypothetical protein